MRFLSFLVLLVGVLFYMASLVWTSALSSQVSQRDHGDSSSAVAVAQAEPVVNPTASLLSLS